MSDNDTRKSMDDVLASIRRIVRAEREAGVQDAGRAGAAVGGDAKPGDSPLELTSDMMSGVERAMLKRSSVAEFVSAPEPLDEEETAKPPRDEPAAPSGLDEDRIRELVREVVREELADGSAASLVRDIIRAELTTGEIGANISRNVLRLIRSEVAKSKG